MIKIAQILNKLNFQCIKGLNEKQRISIISAAGLVLVICLVLFFSLHSKIHDLPSIMKSGRLTVLTDSTSTGFNVESGGVTGFQYELVKTFADSLGLELVISEQNDLKSGIEDLQAGEYDIIASFIPLTSELKNKCSFTVPIVSSRQVLIQRIKNDTNPTNYISKHIQLANDTIYISENSLYKMRLLHLSDEIANPITIIEMKNISSEQMARMVSMGQLKNTICDEQLALRIKQKYPNLDVSLPVGFEQQQAWVVNNKSPKLLKKLNEFLTDFVGSSAYWRIYRKYYN
jgi:membrane-bound lytic murein transglycosylase MltF